MDKQKIIKQISTVGILGNILLSAFKLLAGVLGSSTAMVSDAVHSLSDVLATFVAYVGSIMAEKESDEDHPYGHERFECIAASILGLILIFTGGTIGYKGIVDIIWKDFSQTPPTILPLIAALVSIATKETMYHYTMHYAIKLDSSVFKADAWHHRSDAISSIGSLVGIIGARMGFKMMDSVAAVLISIFIVRTAILVLRDACSGMMDVPCDKATEESMRTFVEQVDGVKRIDILHTRMFGNRIYVDIEIAVRRDSSLLEAHGIAECVHDGIEKTFPAVKHVMVHVNPMEE